MERTVQLSLLDSVRIASPCPARWEDMQGDEKSRFCGQCRQNVYNISAMTRDEAESLILLKDGKMCARLFRRADGTVLTADCPIGIRVLRQNAAGAASRIAACLALMFGSAFALAGPRGSAAGARLRQLQPFATICEWISPSPPLIPLGGAIAVGKIAAPPPTPISNPLSSSSGASVQN